MFGRDPPGWRDCSVQGSKMLAPDSSLADQEWLAPVWGNYQSNLRFLQQVQFFDCRAAVLEIGCGKGLLLKRLWDMGYSVCGIDIDPAPIAECHASLPMIDVRVASGDAIPFEARSFDVVLSFDVFEHIRDSDRHLQEVARVLKPGGRYLLQTPNKWTNLPFELLRCWRKYGVGPFGSYRKITKEHCALHNYWQLRRRFARHGFHVTFVDVPVVNDYFITKLRTYLGAAAGPMLSMFNPDRFPQQLRTNFYLHAQRTH